MTATATLPTDPKARKAVPIFSGVVRYFPDALAAVAELSRIGNDQHNPGKPLHWDRSKSGDELDALVRHLIEAGTIDTDGVRHSTKVAWRALANLQKEIERERETVAQAEREFATAVCGVDIPRIIIHTADIRPVGSPFVPPEARGLELDAGVPCG